MTEIHFIQPKGLGARELLKAKWLVVTSGAGVRALPHLLGDLRKLAGKKIAAVGRSTALILQGIGLKADWVGPGPGSEALALAWPGKRSEPVLHITGDAEDGRFVELLEKRGYHARRVEVYRNSQPQPPPRPMVEALSKEGADWVVFASGTAAERFRRLIPRWSTEPRVVAIGPTTARRARQRKWHVKAIAAAPSAEAVLAALLRKAEIVPG